KGDVEDDWDEYYIQSTNCCKESRPEVVLVRYLERLSPCKSGGRGPPNDHQGDHHVGHSRTEGDGDHHRDDERGQREDNVCEAHEELVEQPPLDCRYRADYQADDKSKGDDTAPARHIVWRSDDDTAEDVSPQRSEERRVGK